MNTDAFLSKLELLYREIERLNDENADLKAANEKMQSQLEKHVNKCLTCQENHCLHHVNLTIGQGE